MHIQSMKQDEIAMIDRILDGAEHEYKLLIDRYKEGLYRHCFRFVRDEDNAEDLTQMAFIRAYVHLADYDGVHAFSTWLYKIATNLALNELRRNKTVRLDDEFIDTVVSPLPTPDRLAVHQELRTAVERLPAKHKKVVQLHYWQGKSYEQIADDMNTTTGSVKGWMNRAKRQLKEFLS